MNLLATLHSQTREEKLQNLTGQKVTLKMLIDALGLKRVDDAYKLFKQLAIDIDTIRAPGVGGRKTVIELTPILVDRIVEGINSDNTSLKDPTVPKSYQKISVQKGVTFSAIEEEFKKKYGRRNYHRKHLLYAWSIVTVQFPELFHRNSVGTWYIHVESATEVTELLENKYNAHHKYLSDKINSRQFVSENPS